MKGLSVSSLKHHPALLPLFAATGLGIAMCGAYVFRLATKNPDVQWNRTGNPRPWDALDGKQYKFMKTRDDFVSKAPKLD